MGNCSSGCAHPCCLHVLLCAALSSVVLGRQVMSPRFLFRIDEIGEDPNGPVMVNNNPLLPAANWIPCISRDTIRYQSEGASGIWWLCNGQGIERVPGNQLPRGTTHFKSISMFFCDGFGFLLYRGDATRPNDQGTLQPLRFDHYTQDYSSYLTEAGQYSALICRRSDQEWVQRLLPDIYHGQIETPYQQYGALKGDLGILLGLIAFALHKDMLQVYLPSMFVQGEWKTYNTINGRTHQRGVVVYIYTCPSNWPVNGSQGSTEHDLSAYEDGAWGKYYN